MPRAYKKVRDAGEDTRTLNENFDNISLDMADGRGAFSSQIFTAAAITVPASGRVNIELSILDVQKKYQEGRLPAIFRWTAYIDNNGDGTYIWPLGSNISTTLLATFRIYEQNQYYILNAEADEKATITMTLANFDSVDHDFYMFGDVFYMPGPDLGAAKRAVV